MWVSVSSHLHQHWVLLVLWSSFQNFKVKKLNWFLNFQLDRKKRRLLADFVIAMMLSILLCVCCHRYYFQSNLCVCPSFRLSLPTGAQRWASHGLSLLNHSHPPIVGPHVAWFPCSVLPCSVSLICVTQASLIPVLGVYSLSCIPSKVKWHLPSAAHYNHLERLLKFNVSLILISRERGRASMLVCLFISCSFDYSVQPRLTSTAFCQLDVIEV